MQVVTQKRLKELLVYSRLTGVFTRRRTTQWYKKGDVAGRLHHSGGIDISIDNVRYASSNLAWLYVTGKWPKEILDHENHKRSDNSFKNLKEKSQLYNSRNRSLNKNNTSGFTGVVKAKYCKGWVSQIRVSYKYIYLGFFKYKKDAVAARKAANVKYGFHKNHGRK